MRGSALDSLLQALERRPLPPWRIDQGSELLGRFMSSGGAARALHHLQRSRLADTLAFARELSPYYGSLLADEALTEDPEETLARLPATEAHHLQRWTDFLCVPEDEINAIHTTSGTTGEPKIIAFTYEDLQRLTNMWAVGMLMGHRGVVRALILLPSTHGLWIGTASATRAVERAGGLPIPLGTPHPAEAIAWMRRLSPNIIISSPSYLAAFTRQAEEEGFRVGIDGLILGGEPLDEQRRAHFEEYWGARVTNSYGTTEIGGPQTIALPGCRGLHVNEIQLFPEILDLDHGRAAEEGDLIMTTLNREAMPLLRYRTGDRARWVNCECGMPFRCIELLGRSDDMIIAGGIHIYAQVIADVLSGVSGTTGRIQVEIDRRDVVDHIVVSVEGRDVMGEEVRAAVYEVYPRLQENAEAEDVVFEVRIEADLGQQIKAFRIIDRRE